MNATIAALLIVDIIDTRRCTSGAQARTEMPDHSRPPLTTSQWLDERNP